MAQHTDPRFLAGARVDFAGNDRADAAEPSLAVLLRRAAGDEVLPLLSRALGCDHQREVFALALAFENLRAHRLVAEWDLGYQDHIPAARNPRVRGDPARIAPHDLKHHHAIVALRGGAEPVERVGGAGHRGIEAEGQDRGLQVVINGLGHADDRDALLEELLGDAQGSITADAHQGAQAQLPDVSTGRGQDFAGDAGGFAVAGLGGKPALVLVRRAENGAPGEEQGVHLLVIQRLVAQRIEEALVSIQEADGVPSALAGALDDSPDDGVEAGAIAPARENANAFAHGCQSSGCAARSPIRGLGRRLGMPQERGREPATGP